MKKRIIITPYFDATLPGGGGLYSLDLARIWLKEDYQLHIICSNYPRELLDLSLYLQQGRLIIHPVCEYRHSVCFPNRFNEDIYVQAKQIINDINPEVIFIHNFMGLLGAVWAAVESGYPTIYTALDFSLICLNGYLFDGTLSPCSGPDITKCRICLLRNSNALLKSKIISLLPKSLFKLLRPDSDWDYHKNMTKTKLYYNDAERHFKKMLPLLACFSAVIAPSPIMAQILQKYGASSKHTYILVYGISQDKKNINPVENNTSSRLRLIFLGHAAKIKGLHIIIESLTGLPDGLNLEVRAYGESSSFVKRCSASVRRYLKSGGLLVGKDVTTELANTDAVLVPSLWYENSPFVVLESLANKKPVIASNQPGISHLIKDGKDGNGLLLPPGDISAWRDMFYNLAKDNSILKGMQKNCYYDKTIVEYCQELENIISKCIK